MKSLISLLIPFSFLSFYNCEPCIGCGGRVLSPAECALLAISVEKAYTGTPDDAKAAGVSYYLGCVAPKE
ncbi:hypothetical protein CH365_07400 [Leptospira neocaledonica]|uniref:Uncharacterized protein n=1 Tax=Leptospira neocaledonica TaxID=2023192 RepID=A0A2M9ZZE6_9LEPT|nr:hypothetical protein CH365_07400 [Leptospira neocaledonica]